MDVARMHNVTVSGPEGARPMVFAHGFGCDQAMWRHVAPRFADTHRVVVFDHAGAGGAHPDAYDADRHSSIDGYAADVVAILEGLELSDVVFVGHSVSAMIGVVAARSRPDLFGAMVLVSPSPRFLDDPTTGYVGGFSEADVTELLESLESNYLGWSTAVAPMIMGTPDRPELEEELTESFCRTDPEVARRFAAVTFLADNRDDLPHVDVPALVLQTRHDALAAVDIGRYVADALPQGRMVLLDAVGHCPNLSAPDQTAEAIAAFIGG